MAGQATKRLRRGFITCPICASDCFIRDSDNATSQVKDLWVQCSDLQCGASFKWQMQLVYQIAPSGIDRPGLDLPQAPDWVKRRLETLRNSDDPNQTNIFDCLDEADDEPAPDIEPRAATG